MAENKGDGAVIKQARVISVDDPNGCGRILVQLFPEDSTVNKKWLEEALEIIRNPEKWKEMITEQSRSMKKDNKQFYYAFPLIPKPFFIIPKVGEFVLIITAEIGNGNSQRYYAGPIIPQLNDMYCSNNLNAMAGLRDNKTAPKISPSLLPDSCGSFPNEDDVAIIGRKDCDIQLTDNDVRVKAGVKVTSPIAMLPSNSVKFNKDQNAAYMLLRYYDEQQPLPYDKTSGYQSVANIVADKINLIGNKTNNHDDKHNELEKVKTCDEDMLILDDDIKTILNDAHKLPYGDKLVEILQRFWNVFMNHTHEWAGEPPSKYVGPNMNKYATNMADNRYYSFKEIKALDADMHFLDQTMLSDNVRIN